MKRKKFRAILINKHTIIKFFLVILALGAGAFSFFSASHLAFSNAKNLESLARYSWEKSLPDIETNHTEWLDFFRYTAAKAAGLDFFSPQIYKIEPIKKAEALKYTPVSDNSAEAEKQPLSAYYDNIEEKTLATSASALSVDNKTSFTVDTKALLNAPLPITGKPKVLIVHTHTTESYTPSEKYNYTPETNARTKDTNFNVARVGEEFAASLREEGIDVIHDKSLNDYPSYNGSYAKSLALIESYLKKYPSIQIVIDIHRDSMTAQDGTKYKLLTEIDGQKAAQLMIISGTNEGGLTHPDWQENLKLTLKIQNQLSNDYNNLARPLSIRKERFNTHATKGSMLIEIGTDANTLDEAILSARLAAKSFAKVINTYTY